MTLLEVTFKRRDLRTAQETFDRIHFKDQLQISRTGSPISCRLWIEDSRASAAICELRRSIRTLSLCGLSRIEDEPSTKAVKRESYEPVAFRAATEATGNCELITRRMFGFKTFNK